MRSWENSREQPRGDLRSWENSREQPQRDLRSWENSREQPQAAVWTQEPEPVLQPVPLSIAMAGQRAREGPPWPKPDRSSVEGNNPQKRNRPGRKKRRAQMRQLRAAAARERAEEPRFVHPREGDFTNWENPRGQHQEDLRTWENLGDQGDLRKLENPREQPQNPRQQPHKDMRSWNNARDQCQGDGNAFDYPRERPWGNKRKWQDPRQQPQREKRNWDISREQPFAGDVRSWQNPRQQPQTNTRELEEPRETRRWNHPSEQTQAAVQKDPRQHPQTSTRHWDSQREEPLGELNNFRLQPHTNNLVLKTCWKLQREYTRHSESSRDQPQRSNRRLWDEPRNQPPRDESYREDPEWQLQQDETRRSREEHQLLGGIKIWPSPRQLVERNMRNWNNPRKTQEGMIECGKEREVQFEPAMTTQGLLDLLRDEEQPLGGSRKEGARPENKTQEDRTRQGDEPRQQHQGGNRNNSDKQMNKSWGHKTTDGEESKKEPREEREILPGKCRDETWVETKRQWKALQDKRQGLKLDIDKLEETLDKIMRDGSSGQDGALGRSREYEKKLSKKQEKEKRLDTVRKKQRELEERLKNLEKESREEMEKLQAEIKTLTKEVDDLHSERKVKVLQLRENKELWNQIWEEEAEKEARKRSEERMEESLRRTKTQWRVLQEEKESLKCAIVDLEHNLSLKRCEATGQDGAPDIQLMLEEKQEKEKRLDIVRKTQIELGARLKSFFDRTKEHHEKLQSEKRRLKAELEDLDSGRRTEETLEVHEYDVSSSQIRLEPQRMGHRKTWDERAEEFVRNNLTSTSLNHSKNATETRKILKRKRRNLERQNTKKKVRVLDDETFWNRIIKEY